jgi:two-component system OmpR family sensor kinase
MSIRLRLTLTYSAILALLLIIISVTLYFTQVRASYGSARGLLTAKAERIINAWPSSPDVDRRLTSKRGDRARFVETYVQTRNLKGDVIEPVASLGDLILPLSDNGLKAVQRGEVWIETASVDPEQLLIYNQQVAPPDGTPTIIQVALSMTARDQFLSTLRNILVIGSVAILTVTFGISWLLAGLALRPIHRITQTARVIGAERNFDRRVDHPGPNDEIGQLATTFNDMLTELQAAYLQVEQSLQAQQRFVADASHELRTPLTTLRGNIDLLQREPPIRAEDRADILADMVDETERLMRLVNDLLMLARADARRPLPSQSVLIQPLLKDVCDQAQRLAPQRTIICNSCPDVSLVGDQDALKQVLLVLLDNALKHTPPEATITITTTDADEQVSISVGDNGPGIEPALRPHIFDRFYRGDAARTGSGSGLGLAIAKELTEAQNGTITVDSQVGQGSVFTLTFPKSL